MRRTDPGHPGQLPDPQHKPPLCGASTFNRGTEALTHSFTLGRISKTRIFWQEAMETQDVVVVCLVNPIHTQDMAL